MKLTSKMLKQMITEELEEGLFDRLFGKEEQPKLTKDQLLMQKDPSGRFLAVRKFDQKARPIRVEYKKLVDQLIDEEENPSQYFMGDERKQEDIYTAQTMKSLHFHIAKHVHFLHWDHYDSGRKKDEKYDLDSWVKKVDDYMDYMNERITPLQKFLYPPKQQEEWIERSIPDAVRNPIQDAPKDRNA